MTTRTEWEFLKDEWILVQGFYEDIDRRALLIKGWGITVGAAALGGGFAFKADWLWLVGAAGALAFWYMEAFWRGLSHFFGKRIAEIEAAFSNGPLNEISPISPMQLYSRWDHYYRQSGSQTRRFALRFYTATPHWMVLLIGVGLFAFNRICPGVLWLL